MTHTTLEAQPIRPDLFVGRVPALFLPEGGAQVQPPTDRFPWHLLENRQPDEALLCRAQHR